MSLAQRLWSSTGSTERPMIFTLRRSNSGLSRAIVPSSVVQTGVKAFGCENRTPQELPSQSWNLIFPSVVCASKLGAVSPIRNDMEASSDCRSVLWNAAAGLDGGTVAPVCLESGTGGEPSARREAGGGAPAYAVGCKAGGPPPLARGAELGDPRGPLGTENPADRPLQLGRESRRTSCGRDRDGEIAAMEHCRHLRIRDRRRVLDVDDGARDPRPFGHPRGGLGGKTGDKDHLDTSQIAGARNAANQARSRRGGERAPGTGRVDGERRGAGRVEPLEPTSGGGAATDQGQPKARKIERQSQHGPASRFGGLRQIPALKPISLCSYILFN